MTVSKLEYIKSQKETKGVSKNFKDLIKKSQNLKFFDFGQELVSPAHLKAEWSNFSEDLN